MISRRIINRLELYKYIRIFFRLSPTKPSARLVTGRRLPRDFLRAFLLNGPTMGPTKRVDSHGP